jgi:hypothetical protein
MFKIDKIIYCVQHDVLKYVYIVKWLNQANNLFITSHTHSLVVKTLEIYSQEFNTLLLTIVTLLHSRSLEFFSLLN